MPSIYISELANIGQTDAGQAIPIGEMPPLGQQKLAVGAASLASAAFAPSTKFVRVVSDVAVCIAFGAAPVATTGNLYLPANTPEYFGVLGDAKLAVIAAA